MCVHLKWHPFSASHGCSLKQFDNTTNMTSNMFSRSLSLSNKANFKVDFQNSNKVFTISNLDMLKFQFIEVSQFNKHLLHSKF